MALATPTDNAQRARIKLCICLRIVARHHHEQAHKNEAGGSKLAAQLLWLGFNLCEYETEAWSERKV
jgi:hypothetical protein